MKSIYWLEDVTLADVAAVGGKNASSGEMIGALAKAGICVPAGFATSAAAYRDFLGANDLEAPIRAELDRLHDGRSGVEAAGQAIRNLMLAKPLPAALADAIRAAYRELARRKGTRRPAVAVRSSATAEDLAGASFAGQQETFLNIRGEAALLDACRRCFASLFTARAITYREIKGFDHLEVGLSVGVQLMVRSDLGAAGVMFTLDTETGFPRTVGIAAAWGLGEAVVQGAVEADQYAVFKPLLDTPGCRPVVTKRLGAKAAKIVYGRSRASPTRQVRTSRRERDAFALDEADIVQLARWGVAIEAHYGRPMDVEWAKDGENGALYILQARPETVHAERAGSQFEIYRLDGTGKVVAAGAAVGSAVAAGRARLVRDVADLADFADGDLLVAEVTSPDWLPAMKRAAGIVTDHGGPTSHAAIVSRELGIPAVVGTGSATKTMRAGRDYTLSCAGGEMGQVFEGRVPFSRERVDVARLPATRTELMVNLADPEAAFRWWRLPAKGIGLARLEFVIGTIIRAHPMALAHPERLSAADARAVARQSRGHASPADYFVDTLARAVAKLAATFHPYPAIVRLSDFKTNEYAGLVGGSAFEPAEENPMIGFRGASRYADERYRDGFALECRALKRARQALGFANIIVMVPFCRTVGEADRVLAEMARHGLVRGEHGLQVYMMCEVPSNVILAEAFASRFDGFSIGSNDLTQLTLGADRDSELLADLFDERDPAVLALVAQAIAAAHAAGIKIGLCGQGPSDHPDYAAFLVDEGIDSISLNPDSFVRTAASVAEAEARAKPAAARGPALRTIAY